MPPLNQVYGAESCIVHCKTKAQSSST